VVCDGLGEVTAQIYTPYSFSPPPSLHTPFLPSRFTIKPFVRNTEIEQAYFAAGSYPLAPTLAAPWRDIPTCVKAVEAVVAAFKASPARKEWEAAAVQHQRQRRR
jgi:hypothetical protein